MTRSQTRVWSDSRTLWEHVLEHQPFAPLAHANLSALLVTLGENELARDHALKAIDILPGNRTGHITLARASLELGDLDTAERHLRISLEIRPEDAPRMMSLAFVCRERGSSAEAEQLYRRAVELEPDNAEFRYQFAGFLVEEGRYQEAIELQPDNAGFQYELASFLASEEKYDGALILFRSVLQLDPTFTEAYYRAGYVRKATGDYAEAIAVWEDGLGRAPGHNAICTRLAWVLATCPDETLRNGARAVTLARRAVEDSRGGNPSALEALAAALARTGQFEAAIDVVSRLLEAFGEALDQPSHQRVVDELDAYRAKRPYTEHLSQSR